MKKRFACSIAGLVLSTAAPLVHAVMPPDVEPLERQRAGAPGSEMRQGDSRSGGNDVLIRLHRAATGGSPPPAPPAPPAVEQAARCCEVSRVAR